MASSRVFCCSITNILLLKYHQIQTLEVYLEILFHAWYYGYTIGSKYTQIPWTKDPLHIPLGQTFKPVGSNYTQAPYMQDSLERAPGWTFKTWCLFLIQCGRLWEAQKLF
jgi:hypothetical protein